MKKYINYHILKKIKSMNLKLETLLKPYRNNEKFFYSSFKKFLLVFKKIDYVGKCVPLSQPVNLNYCKNYLYYVELVKIIHKKRITNYNYIINTPYIIGSQFDKHEGYKTPEPAYYENFKTNSVYKSWYENGALMNKGRFKVKMFSNLRVKCGMWINYYENNKIESEGLYKNNKKYGLWKYYNKDGILIKECKY